MQGVHGADPLYSWRRYQSFKRAEESCKVYPDLYKQTLQELADTVWDLVVRKLPFMKDYR